MIYVTKNYLLAVEVDNNWGGTLYYLYKKNDLLNGSGLQKPVFNLYSTEYEGDDKQLFNELEDFIYKDSASPEEDFREIMISAVGLTEAKFNEFNS